MYLTFIDRMNFFTITKVNDVLDKLVLCVSDQLNWKDRFLQNIIPKLGPADCEEPFCYNSPLY